MHFKSFRLSRNVDTEIAESYSPKGFPAKVPNLFSDGHNSFPIYARANRTINPTQEAENLHTPQLFSGPKEIG